MRRDTLSFAAGGDANRAGHTLIELLAALVIVAVLASIAIGAGQRASEAGKAARARAELQALAAGLESYRRDNGDYPRTDRGGELLQALLGRRTPDGATNDGRGVIELAHFTTENGADPFVANEAALIDPWETPYRYTYRPGSNWVRAGYLLYSCGPDGVEIAPTDEGRLDENAGANRDNLFANQ